MLDSAQRSGIAVWATLHEGTVPRWFDDAGGNLVASVVTEERRDFRVGEMRSLCRSGTVTGSDLVANLDDADELGLKAVGLLFGEPFPLLRAGLRRHRRAEQKDCCRRQAGLHGFDLTPEASSQSPPSRRLGRAISRA